MNRAGGSSYKNTKVNEWLAKQVKCEGSGMKPVPSKVSILYPSCPICGQEFSSQGRKSHHYGHNYWIEGCPVHYRMKEG